LHKTKKTIVLKNELRAKAIPKLPTSKAIKKVQKFKAVNKVKVFKPILIAPLEIKSAAHSKIFSREGRASAVGRPLKVDRATRTQSPPLKTVNKVEAVPKVLSKNSPTKTGLAKKNADSQPSKKAVFKSKKPKTPVKKREAKAQRKENEKQEKVIK
jgi:hypothetical protein